MVKIEIICANCQQKFMRERGAINQAERLGRKCFCSRKCSSIYSNNIKPRGGNAESLPHFGRKKDAFSPFRFFMRRIRSRSKTKEKLSNYDCNLEYLKTIWEEQKGICPITGWVMALPIDCDNWEKSQHPKNASLDRIDPSKGYVRGNIRFVSYIANLARAYYDDETLIEFCKAVDQKRKNTMHRDIVEYIREIYNKVGNYEEFKDSIEQYFSNKTGEDVRLMLAKQDKYNIDGERYAGYSIRLKIGDETFNVSLDFSEQEINTIFSLVYTDV